VGLIAASSVAVVMIPVAAVAGGIYMHKKHKRQRLDRELMQAEITRRALPLPSRSRLARRVKEAGSSRSRPRRSNCWCDSSRAGRSGRYGIDLPELSQLHIKPKAAPAKAQRSR
jgi:hypothetical protein